MGQGSFNLKILSKFLRPRILAGRIYLYSMGGHKNILYLGELGD